jgi:hypothetical protein
MGARPTYSNFSAYVQDTWKLSRRLTLDFGVRWEVNPAPGEANGNLPLAVNEIDNLSAMQLAPRGSKMWKTTYNNLAPRLGIAYLLREKPGRGTVLRGGFGVYYDTGNDQASRMFLQGFPLFASIRPSSVSFPLVAVQVMPPTVPVSLSPPFPAFPGVFAFDPALKLPYTLQWNLAVAQSLGRDQALTVSYVGAAGRRLLQSTAMNLSRINPTFTGVTLTRNASTSDYDALQAQFQRRLSRGMQALVSYTWSHALDDDSSSSTSMVAQRGNAAFDIRHTFAAAITYDLPSAGRGKLTRALLGRWSIDTSMRAQSGLPVDIGSFATDPVTGQNFNRRPNVNLGVPWYVDDPTVPGGRRINRAAFSVASVGQGSLGRNQLRGLGAWQIDFAARREFKLTEKLKVQFRAEAFNLFNHPNFGAIQTSLTAANFGQATNMLGQQLGGISPLYQIGGPRSFQFALKLLY